MTIAMNQNIATAAIGDRVDPGLAPKKNPTVGKDGRDPLSHAAYGSTVDTPQDKAGKRKKNSAPIPAVPKTTARIVRLGVYFAGICAAAMSAPTLYNLAQMAKFPPALAWLFPACIDGYAVTSIQFGKSVPAGHPAAASAEKNARFALAITVVANAIYHLLALAESMIPSWMPVALLVAVASLPPFIVHRLMHLHSLAKGDGTQETAPAPVPSKPTPARELAGPARGTAPSSGTNAPTGTAPGTARGTDPGTASPAAPERASSVPSTAVPSKSGTRTDFETWVERAVPLWNAYVKDYKERPIAAVLANRVRTAFPEPNQPMSDRWDRKLRKAVREAVGDTDDEHAEEGAMQR